MMRGRRLIEVGIGLAVAALLVSVIFVFGRSPSPRGSSLAGSSTDSSTPTPSATVETSPSDEPTISITPTASAKASPSVTPSPTAAPPAFKPFSTWKTYSDSTYSFTVDYPSTWFVDVKDLKGSGSLPRQIYTAEAWGEAGGKGGIEIVICSVDGAPTIDKWIDAHPASAGDGYGICGYNDVRVKRATIVAGHDAISFDWYPGEGGGKVKETTLAFLAGDKVITFWISGYESYRPQFEPVLDHMVASYRDS